MNSEFHECIGRVLAADRAVGTGVILPGGWLLTCAHVAVAALPSHQDYSRSAPNGTIRLEIASNGRRRVLEADFDGCVWGPASTPNWRTAGDYAILRITDANAPYGLDFVRTSISDLTSARGLYCYGFPADAAEFGRSANLIVSNNPHGEGDGLVRIHPDRDREDGFVGPGFSGAPVFGSAGAFSVVGIVKCRAWGSRRRKEAFIIPAETMHAEFRALHMRRTNALVQEREGEVRRSGLSLDFNPRTAATGSAAVPTDIARGQYPSPLRLHVTGWRIGHPRFAHDRTALFAGPTLFGGRFSPRGVPAAYFSLSVDAALHHYSTQSEERISEPSLQAYEIECDNAFDARDSEMLDHYGFSPSDLGEPWREAPSGRSLPVPHLLANRLISEGYGGMVYPSQSEEAGPNDFDLVLWSEPRKLERIA